MGGLFYSALPSSCSRAYKNLHTPKGDDFDPLFAMARAHCEDLWTDFRHLADSNFKREFAINTHQRWFEMYLTVSLIRAGHQVKGPKPGPDVLMHVDDRRIWVEAVCATSGERGRPDSVPPPVFCQVRQEPTEQYVLRIRNALDEKQKKYRTYIQDGIVSCDDVTCVAINVFDVYELDTVWLNDRRCGTFRRQLRRRSVVVSLLLWCFRDADRLRVGRAISEGA